MNNNTNATYVFAFWIYPRVNLMVLFSALLAMHVQQRCPQVIFLYKNIKTIIATDTNMMYVTHTTICIMP